MTRYVTLSKIAPRGTPYGEFTSSGGTHRHSSAPSSPPSSTKGRRLGRTAWSRSYYRIARSRVVDVSAFFSRYRFPKLQRLDLFGWSISSWDLLESRTTSLTTLSLMHCQQSPLPTLSQMLSILSANPNLQRLELAYGSVPHADSNRPSSPIQLRHLKSLHLTSDFHCAFGLLDRLELPDKMDGLNLSLSECSPSDLLQTLGPYLGNRVRRRSPNGLSLLALPDSR
jgi:hypothetical protein